MAQGKKAENGKIMEEIYRVRNLSQRKLSVFCGEIGITSSAAKILYYLSKKQGVSQLDLVKSTGLKPPTISLILQKMQKDNLIERKTDSMDMRVTRVSLTEYGEKIAKQTMDTRLKIADEIIGGQTPEERKELIRLLGLCGK